MTRCEHGLQEGQCHICKKGIPGYKMTEPEDGLTSHIQPNKQKDVPVTQEIRATERNTVRKEDKVMEEVKTCLIEGCEDSKMFARGLCQKHWHRWRNGLIEHPVEGKYKSANPKGTAKKKDKPEPTKESDTKTIILRTLRDLLKKSRSLAETMEMLGDGDAAKLEISTLLNKFI